MIQFEFLLTFYVSFLRQICRAGMCTTNGRCVRKLRGNFTCSRCVFPSPFNSFNLFDPLNSSNWSNSFNFAFSPACLASHNLESSVTKTSAALPGKAGRSASLTHWARLRIKESSSARIRTAARNCDFLVFILGKILAGPIRHPTSYRKERNGCRWLCTHRLRVAEYFLVILCGDDSVLPNACEED